MSHSGWPLEHSELEKYLLLAARAMHLGPNVYDQRLWAMLGCDRADGEIDPQLIRSCFWQFSRDPDQSLDFLRFGPEFLKLQARNIQVFTNATVTQINTDQYGRKLHSVEVSSVGGEDAHRRPEGCSALRWGLENARLLLASNRLLPKGIGNDADLVGRFLMDHPRTSLGELEGKAATAMLSRFGYFQLKDNRGTHFYVHGFALAPDVQEKEGLLNCAAFPTEFRATDDPWDALKRLRTGQSDSLLDDARAVISSPMLLLEGVRQRLLRGRNVTHKLDKLVIDCLVEQAPDPESRITLSDKKDRHGIPLARVHWKISDQEKRSVMRLGTTLASEAERVGFEHIKVADWIREQCPERAVFKDVAHPTGTTRMADDQTQGVVDRNCQVHGCHRSVCVRKLGVSNRRSRQPNADHRRDGSAVIRLVEAQIFSRRTTDRLRFAVLPDLA